MSELQPAANAPHRIDPRTRPGHVHLKVADLERQLAFYQQVLGLRLGRQDETGTGLGAGGPDLVRLSQVPNGRRYRGVTGLYHFALLYPDRRQLALAVARLFALGWPNAPTDHIMTKTTYLDDPEGNTIELYCESPEDGIFALEDGQLLARRADGTPSSGREPLDLQALFSHLEGGDGYAGRRFEEPVSTEVRMGHFHLHVSDLEEARRFYHELLGFDDMGLARDFRMGMVSAGGYHHHVGYNTWQGEGAPPPPPEALGLKHVSFTIPDREAWRAFLGRLEQAQVPYAHSSAGVLLADPSQNAILFEKPA
jgi:catechol 2,3-dioxygenase